MLTAEELAVVKSRTGINFSQEGNTLTGPLPEGAIKIVVHDTGGMVRLTISYLGESVTQNETVNRKFLVREVVRMTKKVLYLKRKKALVMSGHADLILKDARLKEVLGIKEWRTVWAIIKIIVVVMIRSYDYYFKNPNKYGRDPKKVLELQDTGIHSQRDRELIEDIGDMSHKKRLVFLLRMLTIPAITAMIVLLVKYRKSLGNKFRELLDKLRGAVGKTEVGKALLEFFRSLSTSERKALQRAAQESKPQG